MVFMFSLFFFVFGTAIGSFLNVVIYRYNTGMGLNGRSECFSCGKTLQWYELIPLFSFLALRGRCSVCKSKISWQYPLVEFITGCTFVSLYLISSDPLLLSRSASITFIFSCIVASIFIVILVYDIRHKIIPDGLVILLAVLSLISLVVTPDLAIHIPTLTQILAGPILAAPFALLWLISGGRWMGLGDAKLALPMGWFLGVSAGFSALIIAFWAGALVGICMMLLEKIRFSSIHRFLLSHELGHITMKSEIPFAPFLILGFVIVFFFGIDVLHLNDLVGLL
jgi:leader peptidase (prepilin peptidase)/N-methyltransferase